jgi:hypothetical protein
MAEARVSFLMDDFLEGVDRSKEGFFTNLLGEIDAAFYPQILVMTPYDETERAKGKSTGDHIKGMWQHEINEDALAVTFENAAPYGTVLDLGKYPGVGPRTAVGAGGGIYSQQATEGILRPILKKDVLKRICDTVVRKFQAKFGGK